MHKQVFEMFFLEGDEDEDEDDDEEDEGEEEEEPGLDYLQKENLEVNAVYWYGRGCSYVCDVFGCCIKMTCSANFPPVFTGL